MVVQVGADRGQVAHHGHAHLLQMRARPDARQQQQLRRAVDAARDDHLSPGAGRLEALRRPVLDADGAAVLDQDAGRVRVRRDDEVLSAPRGFQIGDRGAPAPAVADGRLVVADAILARAVEVGVARDARLDGRLDDGVDDLAAKAAVADLERAADAVELALAALLVLGLAEVGQDAREVPALAAALAPAVVVGGRAAHVDHAVERAGAAQHLAARLVGGAAVEAGDGLALEFPVVAGVRVELVVADRDVDPGIAVAPAGLEQQHPVAARLRQARRHRAAGGARPRDDEVEGFLAALRLPRCRCRPCRSRMLRAGEAGRKARLFFGARAAVASRSRFDSSKSINNDLRIQSGPPSA